jgi:hypothetical protein
MQGGDAEYSILKKLLVRTDAMPNPSHLSPICAVISVLRLDRYVAAAELARIDADWLLSDDFIALILASR